VLPISATPQSAVARPSRLNRWLAVALVVSLLALLGWLGWRAVRAGLYARAALDDLDRLQAVMAEPSLDALPRAQADIASLQTHLSEARAAARPFLRLAPLFGWMPRVGRDLAQAPQLLDIAVEVSTAGRLAVDALAPVAELARAGAGLDALPQAVAVLEAAGPALAEAEVRMARAEALRASMTPLTEPRLARQLERIDPLLPLARDALKLARVAPALLGADGPRTYLLLAQNSDELRATGGFISGAGHLTVDRGKLVDLTLKDSYAVDNWEQPKPLAPSALKKHMAADLWVLRDANWSPDFTEAADVARALYAQDQGVMTDGAIALDLEAVRLLVGAVGPLTVTGVDEPVTGENALEWMKRAWESPAGATAGPESGGGGEAWWAKRKDFMGELVKVALAKVQAGGAADLDLTAVGRAVYAALDGRHLQVALDDPTARALFAERGWDGGLRPGAGEDFLAVIDTNVGFNKANLFVRQRIDYRVDRDAQGLLATATITWEHTAPAGDETVCDRNAGYGPTYEDLARRCYWNYLRVYAPGGSELLEASGLNDAAAEAAERGTTSFTGDFTLKPGETHAVTLRYRLPDSVGTTPYWLLARKQAGAAAVPLTVTAGACREETALAQDIRFECAEGLK
jgi:hypothetical protein